MTGATVLPLRRGRADGPRMRLRYRDPAGLARVVDPADAAEIAFERCPPVRRIPHYKGSKHTPGQFWSATTGELVAYESFLESKWMTMLDFDPSVVAFCGQPFEITGVDVGDVWVHTPDLFARLADGSGRVIDVKNPRQLDRPDVVLQAQRTAALCEHIGWEYQLVGEPDRQRFANISWLAGFRRPLHAGADLVPRLLALAATPVSLAELLTFIRAPEAARPVIFHLLWHGRLVCDLDAPLRESTLLHAADMREEPR